MHSIQFSIKESSYPSTRFTLSQSIFKLPRRVSTLSNCKLFASSFLIKTVIDFFFQHVRYRPRNHSLVLSQWSQFYVQREQCMSCSRHQFPRSTQGMPGTIMMTLLLGEQLAFYYSGFPTEARVITCISHVSTESLTTLSSAQLFYLFQSSKKWMILMKQLSCTCL